MVTIENQCFSVSQICRSGQCFRLDPAGDGSYELTAGERFPKISADSAEASGQTVLYCSREEYEFFWREYVDMDTSYERCVAGVDPEDEYLRAAAQCGSRMRIL